VTRIERREFVVVGGGLLGLATSWALGLAGRDVVCLEQARVGHEWSGSKGNSRAFRYNYDDPKLNAMVAGAERAWRELEDAVGQRILEPHPFLNVGEGLSAYAAGLRAAGAEAEYLTADEVGRRFPALAVAGPAVLEPTAGMLRADRARDALRATMHAELREDTEVTAVRDGPDAVRIETVYGAIEAAGAVICAGPGTASLLGGMGLDYRIVTGLQQVVYLDAAPPAEQADGPWPAVVQRFTAGPGAPAWYTPAAFPDDTRSGTDPGWPSVPGDADYEQLYGLPLPWSGIHGRYKFGVRHSGLGVRYRTDPLAPDPAVTRQLIAAASTLMRGVGTEPRLVERCVLDYTADLRFVIDRVGRVVVGAGTSGHGFKFGPLLGSVLAGLAIGAAPRWDLAGFSLARTAITGRRGGRGKGGSPMAAQDGGRL
jgi:sarcosine oxidase